MSCAALGEGCAVTLNATAPSGGTPLWAEPGGPLAARTLSLRAPVNAVLNPAPAARAGLATEGASCEPGGCAIASSAAAVGAACSERLTGSLVPVGATGTSD